MNDLNYDRNGEDWPKSRAEIAAEKMLHRAEIAAGDPYSADVAVELSAEIEDLEHDCAGNISRGCPEADELAWVVAVKVHLKSWGY